MSTVLSSTGHRKNGQEIVRLLARFLLDPFASVSDNLVLILLYHCKLQVSSI